MTWRSRTRSAASGPRRACSTSSRTPRRAWRPCSATAWCSTTRTSASGTGPTAPSRPRSCPRRTTTGEPPWQALTTAEEMVQFYDPTDLFGDLAEAIAEQYPGVAPELEDEDEDDEARTRRRGDVRTTSAGAADPRRCQVARSSASGVHCRSRAADAPAWRSGRAARVAAGTPGPATPDLASPGDRATCPAGPVRACPGASAARPPAPGRAGGRVSTERRAPSSWSSVRASAPTRCRPAGKVTKPVSMGRSGGASGWTSAAATSWSSATARAFRRSAPCSTTPWPRGDR